MRSRSGDCVMADELHPVEVEKLQVELEKLRLEVERDRASAKLELKKLAAEAEQAKADASQVRELAKGAALTAEREALSLASERRKEAAYLAGDYANRVLHFTDEVSDKSVARAIETLSTWSRLDPGCDIRIVINSPGGSVTDGMFLFDHIRELSRAGHHVTTQAMGMAASMGAVLLQAGDTRVMARESWLLLHEVSSLAMGSIGEIEDMAGWLKNLCSRIAGIFFERSQETNAPDKLSKLQIVKRMERRDWWVDSSAAESHGFVDKVA